MCEIGKDKADDDEDVTKSVEGDKSEIKALRNDVKAGFQEIKKIFNDIMQQMNAAIAAKICELRDEINNCNKNNASTGSKVTGLEIENNILHKRMTRCDIIATGMSHSNDIIKTVKRLLVHLKVPLPDYDIQQCCFIDKRKEKILIKFNSVEKKDLVMANFFKVDKLKLSDFVKDDDNDSTNADVTENNNVNGKRKGSDINSRVFLNDNLTPIERKLSFFLS